MEGWRQWRLGGEKSLDSDRPSHGRWQHRLKRERPICSERTAHQRLRMEGWRQWRLGGEKSLDSDRPSHGRRLHKCAPFLRCPPKRTPIPALGSVLQSKFLCKFCTSFTASLLLERCLANLISRFGVQTPMGDEHESRAKTNKTHC